MGLDETTARNPSLVNVVKFALSKDLPKDATLSLWDKRIGGHLTARQVSGKFSIGRPLNFTRKFLHLCNLAAICGIGRDRNNPPTRKVPTFVPKSLQSLLGQLCPAEIRAALRVPKLERECLRQT